MKEIRQDIEDVIAELKGKNELLISYKGIGPKTASVLLTEVPELGRLENREIACLYQFPLHGKQMDNDGKKAIMK